MRVGIVDEWLPYPANSGKRLRTLNLISRLAAWHDITYVAPRHDDEEDSAAEQHLRDLGINVHWVPQRVPANRGLGFYARLAANLASPFPFSVQRHINLAMRKAVAHLQRTEPMDLWHVEWTPYAENLRGVVDTPWVIMAHNIESQIWQRSYEHETNPLKAWYIRKQWQKFERYERNVCQLADHLITVSEPDAKLARQRLGVTQVSVVSNGVDLDYFHPSAEGVNGRDPNELLFLGSLTWRPNLDAVQLLLDDLFPKILHRQPTARLTIVGADPPDWLKQRVESLPQIELHGSVPDVRPYLWRCGLMLVPLRIGGGSRLKILEALACRCPVITTRVGAEGLDIVPDRDMYQVEACERIPKAVERALKNYVGFSLTAEHGYEIVRNQYGWNALSEKLDQIWTCTTNNTHRPDRLTTINHQTT